jgi:hypothetical protein
MDAAGLRDIEVGSKTLERVVAEQDFVVLLEKIEG